MNDSKVLIIGAAGYLASFVVERLRGHCQLTLFDQATLPSDDPRADLPTVTGDVTEFADVKAACAGQDVVVHLVALVRERFDKPHGVFADVMVKGTWNVAEACAQEGVSKLVNISSIMAGGWPDDLDKPYRVGDPMHYPESDMLYCLSKQLGEVIALAYHQARGLRVINLRPGVIAGDGMNSDPVHSNEAPAQWFVHVDPRDVAQAVELAVNNQNIAHGTFLVVAGRDDTKYDWRETATALGYLPQHNWPEL